MYISQTLDPEGVFCLTRRGRIYWIDPSFIASMESGMK